MFILSIKQLLRQPAKALLFFLLMAGSTALVVTGAVMTMENNERIQIVEDTYATVGTITQLPVSVETRVVSNPCDGTYTDSLDVYGDPILPEEFDFPGADYIVKPEYRPYYAFYLPELSPTRNNRYYKRHIVEFTPLEDSEDGHMVNVEITKVLYSYEDAVTMKSPLHDNVELHVGDVIPLCRECKTGYQVPLKTGERYVSPLCLFEDNTGIHEYEYQPYYAPHSEQHDAQGNNISEGFFTEDWTAPTGEKLNVRTAALRPVPDDSYYDEGQPGYKYVMWGEIYEKENAMFTTVPVNSLELLIPWHEKEAKIINGREITPEEFESGAAVCMVPNELATINQLKVGDKIDMAFICSYYGETGWWDTYQGSLPLELNYLFNAQGERFEPFWEQEYEIVGTYTDYLPEIWVDTFIVPAKSVGGSDENNIASWNPMSKNVASFQIPNGSIERFDEALHEALGDKMDYLTVTYDDRGYSEIMKSLNASRDMAKLLLLAGVLAALAIVALLLYFFVAKEKKRTAIERSLGMTKGQCRVVMLSALMIMTLVAAGIGSLCGGLMLDTVEELTTVQGETADELDSQYVYDTSYSLWAKNRELAGSTEIEAEAPAAVYFAIPLAVGLLVYALAMALMEYGFSIDPIYLLSTKDKE